MREEEKKEENIQYIFMFDSHLMLFGYIARTFVYAVWHMLMLILYNSKICSLFIVQKMRKILGTFHSKYRYPPFWTKKMYWDSLKIQLSVILCTEISMHLHQIGYSMALLSFWQIWALSLALFLALVFQLQPGLLFPFILAHAY